uniref:Ankyrin repeat protein n=1 Tax=Marseillevirus LCMAC201 TaxID=2506605 RepID=A0A481YVS2_9VIRU|nr:MAG: ankyrin repeat protein [Marseillevirus LCMAC201]
MNYAITDLTSFSKQDLLTLANYYNLSLSGNKSKLARTIATQLYAGSPTEFRMHVPVRSHKIGYMPNDDLIAAVKSNNLELVKELVSLENINLDLQDKGGNTALMWAVDRENYDIVKLLVDNNANLDLQNKNEDTALMMAVFINNFDIVKLLVDNNANLDIQKKYGNTALMLAVFINNFDIVKLLVDNNANLDLQKDGNTALDIAKKKNLPLIIKLLRPKLPFNPQWYQTCSDDLDIITQESWTDLAKEQEPDDPVTIRFPAGPGQPERVECGARENFIQMWKTAPTMVPWVPNPDSGESRLLSGEPLVDNSGHGAIPISGPKFWKITLYHYIMNPELLEEGYSNYIAEKLVNKKLRYGNKKGTFGESETHGQHKTYIYKLKVME